MDEAIGGIKSGLPRTDKRYGVAGFGEFLRNGDECYLSAAVISMKAR
jgi:hypothetical protein